MKTALSLIVGLSALAGTAQAFEFKGAEIGLSYSSFFDEAEDDSVATTTLDGSAEFGFGQNFYVQVDLARHDFSLISESGTTAAVHGIYSLNEQLALGAFYENSDIDDSIGSFGIEGKYDFGLGYAEAYFQKDNEDDVDLTLLGIMGSWDMSEQLAITAAYDYVDIEDFSAEADANVYTFGVRYNLVENTTLTAELGLADGDGDSEGFFGLGIEYNFGPNRGTTFGKRGLFNVFPGL
ncbi:porin [Shimia sp. MMG029]|uniref:porin n=1 Tax=Shimia sp. MMG029 TaxID=3021978 RepID=UPI0022FEAFCD|nr:porin [Shimia sp. MMG029]MDA5557602.1 porin [Shimia sp. MMG029]